VEANDRAARARRVTPYAIIAAVVLAFIWFSVRNPSTQVGETNGIIEAVTFRGGTDDPSAADRSAVIRLPDGSLVHAHIVASLSVHSGQRARVAVYEHVLSTDRTYEVLDARDAN
jgi:hypothetical protein